jgi:lysine biosynthesis protein LysW
MAYRDRNQDDVLVGRCPECDCAVEFDSDAEEGDRTVCPECGLLLEVVRERPLTLEVVDEDDDGDDDDSW